MLWHTVNIIILDGAGVLRRLGCNLLPGVALCIGAAVCIGAEGWSLKQARLVLPGLVDLLHEHASICIFRNLRRKTPSRNSEAASAGDHATTASATVQSACALAAELLSIVNSLTVVWGADCSVNAGCSLQHRLDIQCIRDLNMRR